MPTFSIVATWQGKATAESAGKAVEALDSLFPQENVEELDVGVGEGTTSLHLKLTFSPYPHTLIQKAIREISRSGGRLLELWRLPQEDREAFRDKNLTNARKRPDFMSAAELIREHVARQAAPPRKASPPPAPKEPSMDSLEGAFRKKVEVPPRVASRQEPEEEEEEIFELQEEVAAEDVVNVQVETAEDSALSVLSEGAGEEEEEVFRVELAAPSELTEDFAAGGAGSLEDALAEEAEEAPPAVEPVTPASAKSGAHLRRSQRYDVHLEVDFKTELDFVREHAANISNGGLFIQTEQRPRMGATVEVKVRLPNGEMLHSRARVAHIVDDAEGGGVGLAFDNEDPDFQEALDRYLASLAGPD